MKQLKLLRQNHNLTQKQFAALFGVRQATVSYWEHGATSPDMPMLRRIASHFGVEPSALLDDDDRTLQYSPYHAALDEAIAGGISPAELAEMIRLVLWSRQKQITER